MNEKMLTRISNLLSVKSIITIATTAVFCYQCIQGQPSQEFMSIYSIIIAFYFGTQAQKAVEAASSTSSKKS